MSTSKEKTDSVTMSTVPKTTPEPNGATIEKTTHQEKDTTPTPVIQEKQEKLLDLKTILVLTSVLSGAFLVALDRSIISTVRSISSLDTTFQPLTLPPRQSPPSPTNSTPSPATAGTDPPTSSQPARSNSSSARSTHSSPSNPHSSSAS